MRQRGVLFPVLLWSFLVLIVAGAWRRFGGSHLTTILTILSTVAAIVPLLPRGPFSSIGRRQSTPSQVDEAAEMLAVEVRQQWDEEARRRRLQESQQMPVRWQVDRLSLADVPRADHGELPTLIELFSERPRPLVVIGPPGCGKTGLCVILTVDMLGEVSGRRVPVLLQVSSWNPSENLDTWLSRRLVEDYPFLGNETRFGATIAADIVSQRRVLPILDGLDETPEDLRPAVLRAIDEDWSTVHPFVLTCRSEEFAALDPARVLAGTLVIRLLPLEPEAAATYLLDATSDADLHRWDPVLSDLVDRRDGPLAELLTKPLMLFLARTAYEAPGSTPAELLDRDRFPDAVAIERHLLDCFLPAVFATRPPRPIPSPTRPSRQWEPARAERALSFLATHLHRESTHDLTWWQLQRTVPKIAIVTIRTVLGAVICCLLGWIMFGLFGRPVLGSLLGLAIGTTAALPLGLVHEKRPRRFVPRLLRRTELAPEFLVRDIGFGVVGALSGGLIAGLIYGIGIGIGIGLVFGLVFGLVRRFTEPTEAKEPVTPAGVLRSDRGAVLYSLALGALVGALVGAFLGGFVGAAEYGLVFDLSPTQEGLLGAATGLLLGGAGLGMVTHATSAWGQFMTIRGWLAWRGATPLRLMTFLQDAHRLGVLRQVGASYQFRHALLQRRLAEGPAGQPGAVAVSRTGPDRNQ